MGVRDCAAPSSWRCHANPNLPSPSVRPPDRARHGEDDRRDGAAAGLSDLPKALGVIAAATVAAVACLDWIEKRHHPQTDLQRIVKAVESYRKARRGETK